MGNTQTSGYSLEVDENNNKIMNLEMVKELDKIASDYIHTLSLEDLKNLAEGNTQYCKDLIIVSAKLLNEKYNNIEIKGIFDTKYDISKQKVEKDGDDKFFYSYKKNTIDFEQEERKNLCIKIGKYYVRVAHIFSAIVKALHPMHKTNTGELENYITRRNRKDTTTDIYYKGICEKRMTDLYLPIDGIENQSELDETSNNIKIKKEKLCSKQNNFNIYGKSELSKLKYLYESDKDFKESTLDKLDELHKNYLDTSNYKNEEKNNSVTEFLSTTENEYNSQTGNNDLIFNFSEMDTEKEINPKNRLCQKLENIDDVIQIKIDNKFYIEYKEHIQVMLEHMKLHKERLIKILNTELFEKKNDTFLIKQDLTISKLNSLTEYVRKVIVNMYLVCEEDYLIGLKLLERIIEYSNLSKLEAEKEITNNLSQTGLFNNKASIEMNLKNKEKNENSNNFQEMKVLNEYNRDNQDNRNNYDNQDNEDNRNNYDNQDNRNNYDNQDNETKRNIELVTSKDETENKEFRVLDENKVVSDNNIDEKSINDNIDNNILRYKNRKYQRKITYHNLFNFVEFVPSNFNYIITNNNSPENIIKQIIQEKINILSNAGEKYKNLLIILQDILNKSKFNINYNYILKDIERELNYITDNNKEKLMEDNNENYNTNNVNKDNIYKLICRNILIPELKKKIKYKN